MEVDPTYHINHSSNCILHPSNVHDLPRKINNQKTKNKKMCKKNKKRCAMISCRKKLQLTDCLIFALKPPTCDARKDKHFDHIFGVFKKGLYNHRFAMSVRFNKQSICQPW